MQPEHFIKSFLFALLVITPVFYLNIAVDITLVPRFICLSVVLLIGLFCVRNYPKKIHLTILDICFLGYYITAVISLTWALNIAEALFSTQKVFTVFLTYLILRILWNKNVQTFLSFIILSCIIVSITTLTAVFWQIIEFGENVNIVKSGFKLVNGFSAQRNLLCSFLYLTLIFNVLGLTYYKEKFKRVFLILLVGIQLFVLLLLQTRAVYVALGISGIFFIIGFQWITRYFNLKRAVIAIVVATVFTSALLMRSHTVGDNFEVYLEKANVTKYWNSGTAQERFNIWKNTLSLIKERPFTGVGAGNWATYFPSKSLSGTVTVNANISYQRPHNDFLWVFAETGLMGFLAYVGIFISVFIAGFKSIKNKKILDEKLRIWILLSGLLGYIVIANFSFPKERIEHQIWLALMLASLAYYTKDYFEQMPRISFKVNHRLLMFLAVLGLTLNLTIGYHRLKGEVAMKQVRQDATALQKNERLINEAQSFFYNLDHTGFPLSWYLGIIKQGESNHKAALTYFEEAHKINPYHYRVLIDLAMMHNALGDYKTALFYFNKVNNIYPQHEDTIFNIAILNYKLNDYKAAFKWAKLLPKDYPKRENLIQELFNEKNK